MPTASQLGLELQKPLPPEQHEGNIGMHSPTNRPILGLTFLSLVLSTVKLTLAISGLRSATADDAAIATALHDPAVALHNRMHDFRIGRIYADWKFDLLESIMRVPSDVTHAAIRVAFFLVSVGAASWFAYAWSQSRRVALLTALLATGGLQISIAYQPLVSYPILWLGWACVWSMGAIALFPESSRTRCATTILFAAALAVHEANAIFLLWPVATRLASGRSFSRKGAVRELVMNSAVLLAYVVLSLALRHYALQAGELYSGAKLRIDIKKIAYALLVFSASGIPTADAVINRFAPSGESLLLSPGEWIRGLAITNPLDWAAALLLGVAVWLLLPRARLNTSSLRTTLLLVLAAIAPNVLLVLTEKYQIWAHQRMWPYYYTSMSFLAFAALLATLAARVGNTGTVRMLLAIASAAAVFITSAASHRAVERLHRTPFTHTATQ